MIYGRFDGQLDGLKRCPHCAVARPLMVPVHVSGRLSRATEGPTRRWGLFKCSSCGKCVAACGCNGDYSENAEIVEIFPESRSAHEDIPEIARSYLQQAYDTLHAPDAAAVMAGSAVDAMLKELGYTDGSLYSRIDHAVSDHVLTDAMGNWAHEVRLGSNRPRHADEDEPHVTDEQAQQSVEFAEALGEFLFVLTARIERGINAAQAIEDSD